MEIERIVSFYNEENCYLVFDEEKTGIIIDPGSDAKEIEAIIKEKGVNVSHIFLTHCHYDHIGGLSELRKSLNAKVYASFECNNNIQNPSVNMSIFQEKILREEPADEILADGTIIKIGNLEIKAIHTPGHTDGGMCYLIGDDLFSGDTLFLRNVGRCDLPKGNMETLKNSIINKIYTLDDDIIVHPGHGNDTKIYYEKRYNTYVRG